MAGSMINPRWTMVRTHGTAHSPRPYTPELSDLLDYHCPACGGALHVGNDELVALPFGPGVDKKARRLQRRGAWFDAPAIVLHSACAGESRLATETSAMKVSVAADMLREAAAGISERARTHGVCADHDPTPDLLSMAESTERVSKDLTGWEEQLI